MGEYRDLVSIIVPAYNVEKYIYRSIESLQKQTYSNIEIIIIDDGSTDGTGHICSELCRNDNRVIYIRKKNEGQGIARNIGIDIAKGEYITFADSDDWCAPEYVEKMYQSMKKFDTDICVCGKYAVKLDEEGNIIHQKSIEQWMQPDERIEIDQNRNLIYQIKFSLWSKMFRKELFKNYGILQPSHKYENNTVIPMLVSKAKSLSMVDEPLYYYWINRASSTVNNVTSYFDMIKCLQEVDAYFRKEGCWNEYADALHGFYSWNIIHSLNRISQMKANEDSCQKINAELYDFMKTIFPEKKAWLEKKVTVWGSYNLKKTVKNIVSGKQIQSSFSYSGIVSVVNAGAEAVKRKEHGNQYRENMLKQDINKVFFNEQQALENTDVLFIDLLEERFDACRVGAGIYTKSDVFSEVIEDEVEDIARDDEYWEMWKESCREFIGRLLENLKPSQIVLVKYKLSEAYGSMGKLQPFANRKEIQLMNQWLDGAYCFFEENCVGCHVIDVENDKFFFTDKEYEYGCYPYHLNYMVYEQTAQKIKSKVEMV